MKLSNKNNNILKEWYKEPLEQKKVMIYPSCMSSSEASEIAEQEGLEKEWMGAKAWFEGVVESREEFELEEMPKNHDFVCHMDYIEADLYYDFAGDYYFAVLNKLKTENMKKNKIRITESKLKQIVAESVNKVLGETSYDANGNFDGESHNSDLKDKFKSVLETLVQSMENAINELSYIQTSTTDENISKKARIVINDLLNRGTLAKEVYSSVKADRWDI
jgi:hypothetical protein